MITSLSLELGPDFMSDHITVETSDHCRLLLKLSYNWHFERPSDPVVHISLRAATCSW